MKTRDLERILATLALLTTLAAPALVQTASAMDAPSPDKPEEIIVTGQQTLTQLQLRIEIAQDRMFGLFNALNDDDSYDIVCFEDTRTGTRISQRVCQPEFLRKAIELNGKAFLTGAQGSVADEGGVPGGTSVQAAPPQAEINFRYPILREKMQALVEKDPAFAATVAEHHELVEEMNRRTSSASGD